MEQRDTFDAVAGLYGEVRPGYPPALYDDLAKTGRNPSTTVVSFGTEAASDSLAATLGIPVLAPVYVFEWGRSLIRFSPVLDISSQIGEVIVISSTPDSRKSLEGRAGPGDLPTGGGRNGPAVIQAVTRTARFPQDPATAASLAGVPFAAAPLAEITLATPPWEALRTTTPPAGKAAATPPEPAGTPPDPLGTAPEGEQQTTVPAAGAPAALSPDEASDAAAPARYDNALLPLPVRASRGHDSSIAPDCRGYYAQCLGQCCGDRC